MGIVLYTQRVEIVESYGERRDCADQNIVSFIEECGYLPLAVPNIKSVAKRMLTQLKPIGIIFTGGNSLVKYGGDAPERDETEKCLLKYAIDNDIAIYGFCRGMQMILDYFGCDLIDCGGHVAVRHTLQGDLGQIQVNSFHNQACIQIKEPLEKVAWTEDGVIEAVKVKNKKIFANMWHPERENPFLQRDIDLVRKIFK